MTAFGFPPNSPVPSLYRVLRKLDLTEATYLFNVRAASVPADVLAEVQALFPTATAAAIAAAAIIKQVDLQNTGYNNQTPPATQTAVVEYFEHASGGAPSPAQASNTLFPGSSGSYPSPMGREMLTWQARCTAAPANPQRVNATIWFDVPGLGS